MARREQFLYPYGIFYDLNVTNNPNPDTHDIVIYSSVRGEGRAIGSLLGIFVSKMPIERPMGFVLPCLRAQTPDFEKKYSGRFVPFG